MDGITESLFKNLHHRSNGPVIMMETPISGRFGIAKITNCIKLIILQLDNMVYKTDVLQEISRKYQPLIINLNHLGFCSYVLSSKHLLQLHYHHFCLCKGGIIITDYIEIEI